MLTVAVHRDVAIEQHIELGRVVALDRKCGADRQLLHPERRSEIVSLLIRAAGDEADAFQFRSVHVRLPARSEVVHPVGRRDRRYRPGWLGPGVREACVPAVFGEQLVVGAEFDQPTVVDDGDPVGALDRAEAVGDDDRRPARVSRSSACSTSARCRGRGSTSPRRAPAPPGRPAPPGPATPAAARRPTDVTRVRAPRSSSPSGNSSNRSTDTDRLERPDEVVVGGVGLGHAKVVGDRAVEQEPLLRHDDDALPQRGQRGVAQVDARRTRTVPTIGS